LRRDTLNVAADADMKALEVFVAQSPTAKPSHSRGSWRGLRGLEAPTMAPSEECGALERARRRDFPDPKLCILIPE